MNKPYIQELEKQEWEEALRYKLGMIAISATHGKKEMPIKYANQVIEDLKDILARNTKDSQIEILQWLYENTPDDDYWRSTVSLKIGELKGNKKL